ncbi:MAG: glycine cleavage T C-terminal barrel domain-containing protein, partial [Egibacteraceae bacterium]
SWGKDMWATHDPYAAGLGFAVKLDKPDFVGREALQRAGDQPARRLTCLVQEDPTRLVIGSEPVYGRNGHHTDHAMGFVTSAAHGYTTGESIAYAWLPAALAVQGTALGVEYFGQRLGARVASEPLFDPSMQRMRR